VDKTKLSVIKNSLISFNVEQSEWPMVNLRAKEAERAA